MSDFKTIIAECKKEMENKQDKQDQRKWTKKQQLL